MPRILDILHIRQMCDPSKQQLEEVCGQGYIKPLLIQVPGIQILDYLGAHLEKVDGVDLHQLLLVDHLVLELEEHQEPIDLILGLGGLAPGSGVSRQRIGEMRQEQVGRTGLILSELHGRDEFPDLLEAVYDLREVLLIHHLLDIGQLPPDGLVQEPSVLLSQVLGDVLEYTEHQLAGHGLVGGIAGEKVQERLDHLSLLRRLAFSAEAGLAQNLLRHLRRAAHTMDQ